MEDEFAGENITIFAPNNAAWDELSVDALTYLQSNEVYCDYFICNFYGI